MSEPPPPAPPPPIIIDEFLTFVQNKIDVLDEISITQICCTTFSDAEIEAGKSTLVKALPERSSRNVIRKGEDKSKKNVKDIIKLMKENDPSIQPVFVARNLNRLPAVGFDHVDVSRLLKDMAGMKAELRDIRSEASTKAEINNMQTKICTDLNGLRASILLTRKNCCMCSAPAANKNGQRSINDEASKITTTPVRQLTKECTDKKRAGASMPIVQARPGTKSSEPASEQVHIHTPSYRDIVMPTSQLQANVSFASGANKSDDSFILVTKKKRKSKLNMCGTATGPSKIRVAEQMSSVYISRLTKSTTIEDIREHIIDRGQECRSIELLKQQNETDFNSFKVTILRSKLDLFLSNDFWPVGVKYRLYREYSRPHYGRNNQN